MTSSCSELLRRRMEAMEKVVAPRPLEDASMVTQKRKFAACAGAVRKQQNGQMLLPSADSVVMARAGCAVCKDQTQKVVTVPCVCPTEEGSAKKPLAYQGKLSCPCPNHTPADPSLIKPNCCATNGRTWLANDMPATPPGGWPLPPCKQAARCPEPKEESPCCNKDGLPAPEYDKLYWESTYLTNQGTQTAPCGSC